MSDALVFLARREYTNAIRRRAMQLREPRYLLALGAAIAYLVFLLPTQSATAVPALLSDAVPVEPLLTLGVGGLLYWGWIFADRRTPLEFSSAELTWLFPAPIPRRTLILYKLARWQLPLLFNSLLLTLLFSADRSPGISVRRVLAVWVLLAGLRLHRLAASLVRSRWFEPDAGGRRRSPAVLPATLWLLVLAWAAVTTVQTGVRGDAIEQFAAHPAARVALLPLTLLVHPVFEIREWLPWLVALLPAVGVLAGHVAWVVHADAAFARVAAAAASRGELSELDLREQTRIRPSVGRVLLPLAPTGPVVLALLWKQLAPLLRRDRVFRTGLIYLVLLAFCLLLRTVPAGELATIVVAGLTVLVGSLIIAGPQLVRLDLRRELPRWELLRALPMPGRSVLLGLAGATFVAVMTLQGAGLMLLLAVGSAGGLTLGPELASDWLAPLVLLLPPLNALGSMTAIGGAVLFPAWSAPIMRRGGLDALGTNLLAFAAYLIIMLVLLSVPMLLIVGVIGIEALLAFEQWPLIGAMLLLWVGAAIETVLLLEWLGRRFERTDRAATGLG